MKNKKEIIKAARKIFNLKGAVKNPKIMNPNRDWFIGLLVGLTILILTAYWSASTYMANRSPGMNIGNSVISDVVIYRASHVESALEAYKRREQEHNKLLNENFSVSSGPVIEPSIEINNSTSTGTSTEEFIMEEAVISEENTDTIDLVIDENE